MIKRVFDLKKFQCASSYEFILQKIKIENQKFVFLEMYKILVYLRKLVEQLYSKILSTFESFVFKPIFIRILSQNPYKNRLKHGIYFSWKYHFVFNVIIPEFNQTINSPKKIIYAQFIYKIRKSSFSEKYFAETQNINWHYFGQLDFSRSTLKY